MHNNNDFNLNPVITQFDALPDSAHIRPQTAKILLGVSIATFWRLAKAKKFPLYKLTERTTTVKAGELRAFMSSRGTT